MQSGALFARTQNQEQISKSKCNKKSETNFEHRCAQVCRIHVSFGCNQQLASFNAAMTGSIMQSGV
jgi:hypothetical protein